MTMSATAAPGLAPASSTSQPASAPGPLFGLYALVFTMLGCIGAFAGEVFFLGDRVLSAGYDRANASCLHQHLAIPALDRCVSAGFRLEGWFVAAVALAVPALTAMVSLLTPVITQRRPARPAESGNPAAARFEMLCDQVRLTGQRRPELFISGPAQREAYTTGLPGRRPLVVIPPKLAVFAARDPSRFDPVVLHEIAHVRARDVSWVSSVRHITWITLPVVVLACLPQVFDSGGGQLSGTVVAQAAVFVAGTALIARELLRRREIEADRQAARWLSSPEPLRRLLETGRQAGRAKAGGAGEWWSRLLAPHPSPAARIAALGDPAGRQDGGFVYSLVAGVVAVMAMNTSYFLAWTFDEVDSGWLPARGSAVVAAVVLGLSLTPAFVRRAARGRRTNLAANWWQPVAGTASGVLLGALIPPVATPGATASILAGMDLRRVIITLFLISAGAGLATLTASLAGVAADGRPHRWPAARTAWLTATVCGCSAAALWPIPGFTIGQSWRQWVTVILPADPWRWLVAPYLGTVLLLTAKDWLQGGRVPVPARPGATGRADTWGWRARDAAVLVITPVCAAAVGATLFLARVHLPAVTPYASVVRITEERWWACALTGWAVLVILALAGGVPRLARACLSAWLAAVLAGLVLIAHGAPAVYGTFEPASSVITTSSVLLFYLALPTACLALLGVRRPAVARHTWSAPAGASVAAAVAVTVVLGTGLIGTFASPRPASLTAPPLTPAVAPGTFASPSHAGPAPLHAKSRSRRTQVRLRRTPSPAPPAPRAVQILTQSAAERIAGAVGPYLGSAWVPGSFPAPAPAVVTYHPAGCAALAHEDYLNALPKPLVRVEDRYKAAPALPDDGLETLSVRVESFSQPVPASLLTAASQIFRACPSYTTQTSGSQVAGSNGLSYVTTHAASEPGLGFPAWRADISMDLEPGSASVTWIMITAGRNFMLISQQTISPGSESQPDGKVLAAAVTATVDALARTLTSLNSGSRTGS